MVKKVPSALATALLAAFLSGNAAAVTEQEAHAQLDGVSAVAADAQKAAHAVLSELVAARVPVDQAFEVVRSAVEHDYSANDLLQIGAEIREQVQADIPAGDVIAVADQAIDAGKPAADTLDALNAFQQRERVEQGKPDGETHAQGAAKNGWDERGAADMGGMSAGGMSAGGMSAGGMSAGGMSAGGMSAGGGMIGR